MRMVQADASRCYVLATRGRRESVRGAGSVMNVDAKLAHKECRER